MARQPRSLPTPRAALVRAALVTLVASVIPFGQPAAVADNFAIPATVSDRDRDFYKEQLDELIGLIDHGRGNESKIKRDFKKAARRLKEVPAASYYLGRLEFWDERYDRAEGYFEEAVELNPKFHEALTYLGVLQMKENELDDAEKSLDRALEIAPTSEDALLAKYELYLTIGKLREARDLLAKLKDSDIPWIQLADDYLAETLKPPAWSKEFRAETDNYIVRTGVDQEFAEMIAACAEQVRTLYGKYFMEVPRIGRKYEIFVYRDRGEYHRHGGPRGAGGHYSPYTRNLYLFKYESHSDTMLVLYHEGFHQYLHEYLDSIPQWFNEGLGDFFGGAMINRAGTRAKMGPNPWRVDYVREAMRVGVCPSAQELMLMSREQMYGDRVGVHYAQAWAIVYYCMEGGQSAHKRAIQNYFKALRKGHSQSEAFEASFGRIDMQQFELNWRKFIDKLPSSDEVKRIRDAL